MGAVNVSSLKKRTWQKKFIPFKVTKPEGEKQSQAFLSDSIICIFCSEYIQCYNYCRNCSENNEKDIISLKRGSNSWGVICKAAHSKITENLHVLDETKGVAYVQVHTVGNRKYNNKSLRR